MSNITARRHARRFFGSMGATMRRTQRWFDPRRTARADAPLGTAYAFIAVEADARMWRGR